MANLYKIKTIAEKNNITLESLAEKVGISVQAIHLMVRKNSTKVETLERIAKALNVSILEFFDEEPAMPLSEQRKRNKIVPEEDARVLQERIRGLESLLKTKDEIIDILKNK